MSGLFDLDGKPVKYGNKIADLMCLNVLFVLCSIPIFTFGASYTAMHYVLLKIYRDEENNIFKTFFYAFKSNFKQTTMIWMIYLLWGVLLIADYFVSGQMLAANRYIKYFLCLVTFLLVFSLSWVFVLLSRYENTLIQTLKNAYIIGVRHFMKTVMMILMFLLPFLLILFYPAMIPVVFLLGFSGSGLLQTVLYSKVFEKYEHQEQP